MTPTADDDDERTLRWHAFADRHGWSHRVWQIACAEGELAAAFERGFDAYATAAGPHCCCMRRVFSEPRRGPATDAALAMLVDRYGLEIRRHPGLVSPADADLLELRVADPGRALALFDNPEFVGYSTFGHGPLKVEGNGRRFFFEHMSPDESEYVGFRLMLSQLGVPLPQIGHRRRT